jgi:hypothetical protein
VDAEKESVSLFKVIAKGLFAFAADFNQSLQCTSVLGEKPSHLNRT